VAGGSTGVPGACKLQRFSLRRAGNHRFLEADVADPASPSSAGVAARVEAVIRDVLGLESAAVMLVMALEREFHGKIADEHAARLSTVEEVVDYVSLRIGEQALS
jgi:acyl carrier protein